MDKHKRKQVRNIPFRMIIPNMITSGSVFCGVSSIILTSHGKLLPAAALICFAVFFDVMDGRVARSLGGGSHFGEELDSLADAISFGVAPAFLVYSAYIGPDTGIWGPLAASFFALCGVLRLARFNVTHVPAGPFQGLPIPAGGLTLAAMVIAGAPVTPLVAICAMCFIGALMVSSVPYCNAKRLNKHNVNKVKLYGMTTFIVLCFVVLREKAFLAVALMYIISGLVRFDGAAWIMLDAEDERSAEDKE
ncbi:CDP-diacylglycerol--serine O-phosphatidyltransferase [uncultured Cloacibacillus sp.]|uniref:CDP-diacylglycerol--serine O-phosphatidyltransferase n=1 Tax=uncultured Cloacibacillus sp. TaxID=889794 RepID=UPI001F8B8A2C|nr:CDP-diacylglycerol--serine O-phosphatidyltransferase [uncultured Cloacibacillus sp.]HIR17838.1 CDP-diacylglycerol--serine O-phosphatidyltransferase [Candidatus Caccocola faecigallinarum]